MSGRRSTIYLEPELHKRLRRRGAEEERTVSEMVNSAVAAWLETDGAPPAPPVTATAGSAPPPPASPVAAAAGDGAPRVTPLSVAVLAPPGWQTPVAPLPEGLAPPVRRLFGALRGGDPDLAAQQAAAASRYGA